MKTTALAVAALTAWLFLMGSSGGTESPWKDFVTNAEDVQVLHEIIKTVRFRRVDLAGGYERKENLFVFASRGGENKVRFLSGKLSALCDVPENRDAFSAVISRAVVYGVDDKNGLIEGRVMISGICNDPRCGDEDFIVIYAD